MRHVCNAIGCAVRLRDGQVFCPTHWSMLAREIQHDLADQYVTLQWRSREYTPAWRVALVVAVNYLGLLEGMLTQDEANQREERARRVHRVPK